MVLLFIILILACALYMYSKSKHDFWARRGVKGPAPLPIVGNFGKVLLLKQSHGQLIQDIYDQFPDEKVVGFYRGVAPALLIRDPELVSHMMIKDFHIFQDKPKTEIPSLNKLDDNLLRASGETWRVLRAKLTPLFSSKKLKDMMPLVNQCVDNYINYIEYLTENDIDHEIRSLQAKYTVDLIGSCVFGVHIDAYAEKEDEFTVMAKRVFNAPSYMIALLILDIIIPGVRKLDSATDIYNFFRMFAFNVIKERENIPMKRNDFIDLLIELKTEGKASKKTDRGVLEIEIDDEMIAAQTFIFYVAGYDTASATMSFMIHRLALHQDVQEKVYQEVCRVTAKYDGKITYEAINEMTYLEMVLYETLRMNSVSRKIIRKALTDYTLPGLDVLIPKDTVVYVSIPGIHADKKYYDNPEVFDPENFTPEKKANRPHSSYLAFGEGPRNCIGKRFALIQVVAVVAALVRRFRLQPGARTTAALHYRVTGLTLEPKHGIWVKFSKR